MFKWPFDGSLDGDRFRLFVGVVYDLTSFLQNDTAKNAIPGLYWIAFDLFCICADDGNRPPIRGIRYGQIYSATFCLEQVPGISCYFGKYCFQIQCDRDLSSNLCQDGRLLSAALSLLEETSIFHRDGSLTGDR